jgi:hypothetical protein
MYDKRKRFGEPLRTKYIKELKSGLIHPESCHSSSIHEILEVGKKVYNKG